MTCISAELSFGVAKANAQALAAEDSVLTLGHSEVQASFSIFRDVIGPTDEASILILGTVTGARYPLTEIPADNPGTEITYVLSGLSDPTTGYWDGPGPNIEWGGTFYVFKNGFFRVYADDTPDLNFADPATFQDGELLLDANVPECWFTSGAGYPCPQCYPSQYAELEFTGGSLFSRVSRDGIGYTGWIGQSSFGDALLDSLLWPGTSYPTHGTMGLNIPVAVRTTTWGRIKQLFSP